MALEEFSGFNQNEGMDASAFERFQERMKAAAQQIQAIRKQEKKQKKKETELVQILLKFIKTSHKKHLVLLISRVLERNVPANFILAVALLGNEDIQQEVGQYLMPDTLKLALKAAETANQTQPDQSQSAQSQSAHPQAPSDKSLIFFQGDSTLPLKVRIEIDHWIKGIILQAAESPEKLLKTAYDVTEERIPDEDSPFGSMKKILHKLESDSISKLMANIIFDFLKQNEIEEDFEKILEFSKFLLKGILKKTQEDIDGRVLLE